MSIAPPLTANDLAISEAMNLDLMVDTCVRLVWTMTRNADQQETGEDWFPADPPETSVCKYQPQTTMESSTNVVTTADRVWVPPAFGALLTSRDRLQVTTHGVTFERGIDGQPQVDLLAVVVKLKGSDT